MSAAPKAGAGIRMPTNVSERKVRPNRRRRTPIAPRVRLAARLAVFALVAAMLALMYQGERWMLERPGAAPDPSLIATCALNAVGDLPAPACMSELIR